LIGNVGMKSIWDECEGLNVNLGSRVVRVCEFAVGRLGVFRVLVRGWGR